VNPKYKNGKEASAARTEGKTVYAVNPEMKLREKAEAIKNVCRV
jgi:hypothetical protein